MTSSYIPKKLRVRVAAQARHRCGYCLSSEAIVGLAMEIEHLIPQILGGPTRKRSPSTWPRASSPSSARPSTTRS
jgi:5-methylcytosine-specific restriction endonuclease McrA